MEREIRERFTPLVEAAQGLIDNKTGEILPRCWPPYWEALEKALDGLPPWEDVDDA